MHMTHETMTSTKTEGQHQRPSIVYLVDDDLSFLRALSRLLRAADYRVETFGSAKEFLKCDRSEAAGYPPKYLLAHSLALIPKASGTPCLTASIHQAPGCHLHGLHTGLQRQNWLRLPLATHS
jgi:hypothetical protein